MSEFERFDKGMDVLMKVSHEDLTAALDGFSGARRIKGVNR